MKMVFTNIVLKYPFLKVFFALGKDSIVYLIGMIIIGFGNFFLIPLYTHYLDLMEFGVYALVDVAILVLVTVAQLGLSVSYLKWYADLGEVQRGAILGSAITLVLLTALLCGSFFSLAVSSSLGERWLQVSDRSFAWVLFPIVGLEAVQSILLTDLRARRKSSTFIIYAVLRMLTMLGFSLWFVVVQQKGVDGVFQSRMLCDIIVVLTLLFVILRTVRLRFDISIAADMVRYGLPLTVSAVLAMTLDATGQFFVNLYGGIEQVALYSAAIKLANIFQMLVNQPFGLAWGGVMFQINRQPNARAIYSNILMYVFVITFSIALVLSLFGPALFAILVADEYASAVGVFSLILLMRSIHMMEYPLSIGIYLKGRTKSFATIYMTGWVFNILVNILLTPNYGASGAAWAGIVACTVMTGLMGWISHRHYPLHYEWRVFLIPIVLWMIFLVLS